METRSHFYKNIFTSIINTLEECYNNPELLGIDYDLLDRLGQLDSYGRQYINTQARCFLTITIMQRNSINY